MIRLQAQFKKIAVRGCNTGIVSHVHLNLPPLYLKIDFKEYNRVAMQIFSRKNFVPSLLQEVRHIVMDYRYIRYIFCDNKSIYDENRQLNIFMSPSRHVGKDIHACGLRCLNHVILYKINTTVGGGRGRGCDSSRAACCPQQSARPSPAMDLWVLFDGAFLLVTIWQVNVVNPNPTI